MKPVVRALLSRLPRVAFNSDPFGYPPGSALIAVWPDPFMDADRGYALPSPYVVDSFEPPGIHVRRVVRLPYC